jgi:hypothetical protein
MQKQGSDYTLDNEQVLADGLEDVSSELRLIDAMDLVAFLRTGQFGNVESLVNSSTELHFKPGTVRFGLSGEAHLQWGLAPSVSLDMEFRHMRVCVYFRMLLDALQAVVEIDYIDIEGASDPRENTQRLVKAIANARIARPENRRLGGLESDVSIKTTG